MCAFGGQRYCIDIPYVKYEGTAGQKEVKLEAIEEEKKNEGEKIGIGMGNEERGGGLMTDL